MTEEALLQRREKKRLAAAKRRRDNPEECRRKAREYQKNHAGIHRERVTEWGRNNPDRRKHYALKRKFGITLDQYNEILEKQEGKCAICRSDGCTTGRRLAVDHCHETGYIRGLLCKNCNLMLGHAKDSNSILETALIYINERKP